MRLTVTVPACLAMMTLAAVAGAEPRTILTRDLGEIDTLDASPDGRAWARGRGSLAAHGFVVGPGDEVRRLDEATPPWEVAPKSTVDRLVLGSDGTIELNGARAPLSDALLHMLGPRVDRRALAYDSSRERYVLLRARRPLASGGYDHVWQLVWFTRDRIVEQTVLPEETSLRGRPALAVANGVAWIGAPVGLLRWQEGAWTEFGDEALVTRRSARTSVAASWVSRSPSSRT